MKNSMKKNTTTGGGAITILKNHGVKVNGKDDIPYIYILWKIKFMFQTTNQRKIWGPDGPMGPPWDHGTMVSRTAESRLCV
jgi:hypothetical protein